MRVCPIEPIYKYPVIKKNKKEFNIGDIVIVKDKNSIFDGEKGVLWIKNIYGQWRVGFKKCSSYFSENNLQKE